MLKKKFIFKKWKNELIVELDVMANLAEKSVKITYGNTVVLTTVSYNENFDNHFFFPLQIIFQERLYSIGKIPSNFLKREGRPSEYAILCSRLIDRSIRSLFPKDFVNEVQIINTIFSFDNNYDVRINSALGASLSLSLSSLPFNGPSAIVIVGKINNEFIINPTKAQLLNSKIELIVGGTKDGINMIEAECFDFAEKDMIKALKFAYENIINLIIFQENIIKKIKIKKIKPQLALIPNNLYKFVKEKCQNKINKIIIPFKPKNRDLLIKNLLDKLFINFKKKFHKEVLDYGENKIIFYLHKSINKLLQKKIRNMILKNNIRIDNRKKDDIRELKTMIDVLPVVHGSAIFSRGETQVLSVLTLGDLSENQIVDGLNEECNNFINHYNFPPFSVGKTGKMGIPSRREIGHGSLGKKALLQILPFEKDFPYTIRLVSEVLASDGSTSQAAICSSSMALMAGGVPIRTAIAGISIGLIKELKKTIILTDIQGLEDEFGDMDFKISGTINGICALQMDIKISFVDFDIIIKSLEKAKIARLKILEKMNKIIEKPRIKLSNNAPKIIQKTIPIDKIRDIIGPGGKIINKIINDCENVKIIIKNDGNCIINHKKQSIIDKTWKIIENIINPVQIQIGSEFNAKVVKILNFGVFVNLKNKIDGLIHISEFSKKSNQYIDNLKNFVKINDIIKVQVIKIDNNNKIILKIIDN